MYINVGFTFLFQRLNVYNAVGCRRGRWGGGMLNKLITSMSCAVGPMIIIGNRYCQTKYSMSRKSQDEVAGMSFAGI